MSKRTVQEEAAYWYMELQDDKAKSESYMEWHRWLAASPEHEQAFNDMERTVLRLAKLGTRPRLPTPEEMQADDYDGSVPVTDFLRNFDGRKILSERLRSRYAIAAGLAAIALVGGLVWNVTKQDPLHGTYAFHTAPGERQTITLAEGSKVSLDADSVLNVTLTPERRSLALVRGEAFFDVARDPARPFVVSAGGTQVQAIGTAFNIRMSEDRTIVAVTEGRVEVTPTSKTELAVAMGGSDIHVAHQISAGQAVSYSRNGHIDALPAADATIAAAWREGRRQYLGEPLRDVLADVGRYTGRRIELAEGPVGDLKFTGTLRLENSDAWLKGLSVALPVEIDAREDGTVAVTMDQAR
jgi:transmembrane sensor